MMNFIYRIIIEKNPNIIDKLKNINSEMVSYAISCGYKFNEQTYYKFMQDEEYIRFFYKNDKILTSGINRVLNGTISMIKFYNTYCNKDKEYFLEQIKANKSLLEKAIKEIGLLLENGCFNDLGEVLEFIGDKESLLDELVKKYDVLRKYDKDKIFINYIIDKKDIRDLKELNISSVYDWIKFSNPEKIIELIEKLDYEVIEFKKYIIDTINRNIEIYIPYLDEINSRWKEKQGVDLISAEQKSKICQYLKSNKIIIYDKIPEFVLKDQEYIYMCIIENPLNIVPILERAGTNKILINDESVAKTISSKILSEKIKFEGIIPYPYRFQKNIFESIVLVNPNLLEMKSNIEVLPILTKHMKDSDVVKYYKKIKIPFNRLTVNSENILLIIECLKRDYMTLAGTTQVYSEEQYKQIYEALKDVIKAEDIKKNNFLYQNPYFVGDMIINGIDISDLPLENTYYYEQHYHELKALSIKKGIYIPSPKKYKDIINFNENNEIFIYLENLENLKKGIEYMEKHQLKMPLTVILRQEKLDEFIISDNIEFFQELCKNGQLINFRYNTGENTFSLQEILRDEKILQTIADEIRSKDFSPLERIIAVYDISRNFKPYEDSKGPSSRTRSLYEYLQNEYMVCAGYTDLMANLGHRLNQQFVRIGLEVKEEGLLGLHSRIYENIIDDKYGINGFYVFDPTWDNMNPDRYLNCCLTTEEGREDADISSKIHIYDRFLTYKNPNELIRDKNKILHFIKGLDPEYYKTLVNIDWENNSELAQVLQYFDSKINKPIPKENLLKAIMAVKKSIYIGLTDQDIEDMEMYFSNKQPFCKEIAFFEYESLYGEKYQQYLLRRYENIKSLPIGQVLKENPCLEVKPILEKKIKEILDVSNLCGIELVVSESYRKQVSNLYELNLVVSDKNYVKKISENLESIKEIGIEVELSKGENDEYRLKIPSIKEDISLEEYIENVTRIKYKLYSILGLNEDLTRKLGEETRKISFSDIMHTAAILNTANETINIERGRE